MYDPRLDKLADVLTNHSTEVQPGECVLIEGFDIPQEMVIALIRSIRKAGGIPVIELKHNRIQREIILGDSDAEIKQIALFEAYRMQNVQAYIGIRGNPNIAELTDVPIKAMQRYETLWMLPIHYDIRVQRTKWVVLPWPDPELAQRAGMSTEAFEDYYFDVCTLDYSRMEQATLPLKALMAETDEVHILSEDTDLRFSIKDIPVVPCAGKNNLPDAECFTAPVRDSVNGKIHFNTPSTYQGTTFIDIRLRFENGKIVEASANNAKNTQRLNAILDTDEGARYIGEFSIAFNPYITNPISNILFDGKIAGSYHITVGQAYEESDNGTRSMIHWSLVNIQSPSYSYRGSGEIYFDQKLIRKDGKFVEPALKGLNPENF